MVEQWVEGRPIDDLNLKGFNHPILAAEITSWREEVDNVVDAASAARSGRRSSSFSPLVPAKAGTHTASLSIQERSQAPPASHPGRGVWVPAFAGTAKRPLPDRTHLLRGATNRGQLATVRGPIEQPGAFRHASKKPLIALAAAALMASVSTAEAGMGNINLATPRIAFSRTIPTPPHVKPQLIDARLKPALLLYARTQRAWRVGDRGRIATDPPSAFAL